MNTDTGDIGYLKDLLKDRKLEELTPERLQEKGIILLPKEGEIVDFQGGTFKVKRIWHAPKNQILLKAVPKEQK